MTQTLTAAITIDDATVRFDSSIALDHITTRMEPGRSVAVIGPNGSGKTTLLRLVAGLLAPTSGTVSVPVDALVGYVSQHANQPAWLPLTGADVVRMGRYRDRGLLGRLTGTDKQTVVDAARRLDVEALLDRPYGELSGGQRQRIRLAQALAQRPNVLALDEPITGLDLPSQLRILDVIGEHAAAGGAVVFSTHHLAEARRADRVMLMAGCVLADGAPEDVLVPDLLAEAFGGRLIRDDGSTIVVDDHGHDHGEPHAPDLVPHHGLHRHEHEHRT